MAGSSYDTNVTLPDINIPEKQKNADWHKRYVQAIANQSLNNTYDLAYNTMQQSFQFYQGTHTGEEYKFLQEAVDGEALPAKWINYNKIQTKVDLLLGELAEKGYDIKVEAQNKDAKVRKLEERSRLKTEMKLQPVMGALEQQFGLPVQTDAFVPQDEDELDEYMDYTYKEKSEIIMESALKFVAKKSRWDYERVALFRDILITGRCWSKSEIVNGLPRLRRIDPRYMIFDTNAKDDFLSDSTYFGEVRYMSAPEAAEEYQLTVEELKEAYSSYQEYQKTQAIAGSNINYFSNINNGGTLAYFKEERGELRVLVVTANWVDYKSIVYKESVDKYGNAHFKQVKDTFKGESTTKRKLKVWRKGTIVGGKFLKHWGELTNQVRDPDNLAVAEPQYFGLIPNYFNGVGVSKVQQLKGLQDLKNITLYNVQLAMARAGAKGFIYDIAQLPDGWDYDTALKYLKVTGIAFIDSNKDGLPANYNQFQTLDLTISESVSQYINISEMVDREMDAVSGINEARQGVVKSASQAVGVTQSALMQSNLATATLFRFFNSYTNTAFQHQSGLIKIAWAGKEKFATIIGDAGIDFLQEDIDLSLDSYGVFVEETPKILDNVANFQAIVQAALQAGQIDFLSALKLMQETDVKLAIRRFEKEVGKQAKKAEEAQKQEFAQAQQMQEQQAQAQQIQAQQEQEADAQAQQIQSSSKIEEIKAKGRIDLEGKKIDLRSDMHKWFSK